MKKPTKRGRPQLYQLTAAQTRRIEKLIQKGESAAAISGIVNVHEFAVLRVRRAMA